MDEAEKDYRAALEQREGLLAITKVEPHAGYLRNDIARTRVNLGDLLFIGRRDPAGAAAEYATALRLIRGLLKDDPDR